MKPQVYLDHAATTPLDPRVFEAMLPYLKEHFGNASSVHRLGRRARFAVEQSREQVAALLQCEPGEVIFTGGGSEADNMALCGAGAGGGLLTATVEHEAVVKTAQRCASVGRDVVWLPPQPHGGVTPDQLAQSLEEAGSGGKPVGLVSLMHANNEVGTLNPIAAYAPIARAHGALLHTDAVQTAGLYPLDVAALGVDLLSLSAHKFYGPKGVGALYVRGGVELSPLMTGGSQERKRRAGTENVAGIVGLAQALSLAVEEADARLSHLHALRERLVRGLRAALPGPFTINTPLGAEASAPHLLNVSFPPSDGQPLDGEMLLLNLDMAGVFVSAGSACTSGAMAPSHVLLALGKPREEAAAAVRFSLGKDTTEAEVDYAVEQLREAIVRMLRTHTSTPC